MEFPDWKEDITEYLKNLIINHTGNPTVVSGNDFKDWATFLNQFDGIDGVCREDDLPEELMTGTDGRYHLVVFRIRSKKRDYFPFKISLYFLNDGTLSICYPVKFSLTAIIQLSKEGDDPYLCLLDEYAPNFYNWERKTIELIDNSVLQVMNDCLMQWLDRQGE